MTGCPAAIEAARRWHEAAEICPEIASGRHKRDARCRRLGGSLVCGKCVGDLRPEEMAQRSDAPPAGRDEGGGEPYDGGHPLKSHQ